MNHPIAFACLCLFAISYVLISQLIERWQINRRKRYIAALVRRGITFVAYKCLACGREFNEYPITWVNCPSCYSGVRIVVHKRWMDGVRKGQGVFGKPFPIPRVCSSCLGKDETCALCRGTGVE